MRSPRAEAVSHADGVERLWLNGRALPATGRLGTSNSYAIRFTGTLHVPIRCIYGSAVSSVQCNKNTVHSRVGQATSSARQALTQYLHFHCIRSASRPSAQVSSRDVVVDMSVFLKPIYENTWAKKGLVFF